MTLLIDNYDSFTYNLYQYLAELGGRPVVYRNDEISLSSIKKLKPSHIVISPGPGNPKRKKDFGVCTEVIKKLGESGVPILGVCLGHQGIASVFGGKISHAPKIMHGKSSRINVIYKSPIFSGVPKNFNAMRYHSLIISKSSLPECFIVIAETAADKLIMAIQHEKYPVYGIQFHPESFATEYGKKILNNFLQIKPQLKTSR